MNIVRIGRSQAVASYKSGHSDWYNNGADKTECALYSTNWIWIVSKPESRVEQRVVFVITTQNANETSVDKMMTKLFSQNGHDQKEVVPKISPRWQHSTGGVCVIEKRGEISAVENFEKVNIPFLPNRLFRYNFTVSEYDVP